MLAEIRNLPLNSSVRIITLLDWVHRALITSVLWVCIEGTPRYYGFRLERIKYLLQGRLH